MFNLTILCLSKIYDLQQSPLASTFIIGRQSNYNYFTFSHSNFQFFSQSFIKDYTFSYRKNLFISNSKFFSFLNSPIIVHNDDNKKLKTFEDLTYKNKRFKIKGGILTVFRCLFTKNQAKKGGGLNAEHNLIVNLTDCIFSSNIATFGGGFYIEQADSASISRILVFNNSADYLGGIFLDGNLESATPFSYIDNLNATLNFAKEWTGGVRLDHGGGYFMNSVISSNSAKVCGGFFDQCWKPSKRFVQFTLFFNNSANERVGAFCAFHIMHQSRFENCNFIKNRCDSSSSSIFIESIDSIVEIINCFFDELFEKSLKMKFELSKFILDGNNTFYDNSNDNADSSQKNPNENEIKVIQPNPQKRKKA